MVVPSVATVNWFMTFDGALNGDMMNFRGVPGIFDDSVSY